MDMAKVKACLRRLSNWKAPVPDSVTGFWFWFKKITTLHHVIALGLDDCLKTGNVPDWMVKGRTVFYPEGFCKGDCDK